MGIPDQVLALLDRNGGVITRAQLLELGYSRSSVTRQLGSGDLRSIVPGVYRPSVVTLTPVIRLRAVTLRAAPGCSVTGSWAAWWHGLVGSARGPVHLLVPPGAYRPQWPEVLATRRPLHPADRVLIRNVPVTTRARTVLDCALLPGADDIRDRALQLGTTVASLRGALDRLAPGCGVVAARRLVNAAGGGGVSPPERELLAAIRASGGACWRAGVRVIVGASEIWLDLAVPQLKLAAEIDGWTVHSRSEAFHGDRRRQNLLVGAGWTVLRYTPRQIRDDMTSIVRELIDVERRLRVG